MFTLSSIKITAEDKAKTYDSAAEAFAAAVDHLREYQPAYGVEIIAGGGATALTVGDDTDAEDLRLFFGEEAAVDAEDLLLEISRALAEDAGICALCLDSGNARIGTFFREVADGQGNENCDVCGASTAMLCFCVHCVDAVDSHDPADACPHCGHGDGAGKIKSRCADASAAIEKEATDDVGNYFEETGLPREAEAEDFEGLSTCWDEGWLNTAGTNAALELVGLATDDTDLDNKIWTIVKDRWCRTFNTAAKAEVQRRRALLEAAEAAGV